MCGSHAALARHSIVDREIAAPRLGGGNQMGSGIDVVRGSAVLAGSLTSVSALESTPSDLLSMTVTSLEWGLLTVSSPGTGSWDADALTTEWSIWSVPFL